MRPHLSICILHFSQLSCFDAVLRPQDVENKFPPILLQVSGGGGPLAFGELRQMVVLLSSRYCFEPPENWRFELFFVDKALFSGNVHWGRLMKKRQFARSCPCYSRTFVRFWVHPIGRVTYIVPSGASRAHVLKSTLECSSCLLWSLRQLLKILSPEWIEFGDIALFSSHGGQDEILNFIQVNFGWGDWKEDRFYMHKRIFIASRRNQ